MQSAEGLMEAQREVYLTLSLTSPTRQGTLYTECQGVVPRGHCHQWCWYKTTAGLWFAGSSELVSVREVRECGCVFPYLFPTQRRCGALRLTRPSLALSFFIGKMGGTPPSREG